MTYIKNKKGFSLVELSIVLLIIGIIVAGITQSSRLIRQFRLSSARSQTQSSPANSISGMVLWLETTAIASFADSETEDATSAGTAYVTNWYDINQTSGTKNNATGTTTTRAQRYEGCINNLPCLRFDGTDDVMTMSTLPSIIGSDYTVFVIEQRRATSVQKYFIGGTVSATAEGRLTLGYQSDTAVRFDQGAATDTNYYTAAASAYTTPTPVLHTFMNGYGYSSGVTYGTGLKAYYKNGTATQANSNSGLTAVGTPTNTNLTSAWTSMQIGKATIAGTAYYYNGDIGEIIIYNRALKNEERVAVEGYLLKKWGIREAA